MMKLLLALGLIAGASAGTPMSQTVQLIKGLRDQVEADGKSEQESFDKYACWCEKTMERKANDIANAKELIAETATLIMKLKGEIASHGAEIQQLNKDIADNNAAVKDAQELRSKENKEYNQERSESEQCIGALEAAVTVLTGAGTKSFLQGDKNMNEAELLSVVAGIRKALGHKITVKTISEHDIEVMRHFVSKPDDFVGKHTSALAQVGQNPFGDYAPQSSQIQGILKGMYDAFTSDLEKDNAEEAETQKSFEALHATKLQELATLEATLQKQETDSAAKTKKLSESQVLLDDTNNNLDADSAFFEDTKEACQVKATQWSARVNMRTQELNGMETAINILSSSGAKKTFESSTTTFIQLKAVHTHQAVERSTDRSKAYSKLKALAQQLGSRSVAKLAVELKVGGHFDKVITMIDEMMTLLRTEEQDDIKHRDRCENAQNANSNEMADLKESIKKTKDSLGRMAREKKDLEGDVKNLEGEIKATTDDMDELLKFRNKESKDFIKALKDDTDAVALMKQAIVALSKFYKDNKIALPALVQKKAPEYTKDQDKAPEASFSGDYGGRSSESGGILAILEMLVEDSQKEIKEGRADNADAQEKYLKQNGALQATLDSENESKANCENQLAELEEKMSSYNKFKNQKQDDKDAEEDTKKSVAGDCDWVKTNFASRRDKRKNEMQGLVDAKGFLAGVAAGNDPLPL